MYDLFENWENIKETLREEHELLSATYKTWIQPLELYKVDDDTVTILVTLDNSIDYIRRKFGIPLKVIIAEMTGIEYEVVFIYKSSLESDTPSSDVDAESKISSINANLDPKYTFDTFVIGKNNEFAHAVSVAVADDPGEVYNPLFLYGGAGLGKTHLMHSIAHHILAKDPTKKVLYVTSESFTNDLIDAIRVGKSISSNAMKNFRDKYRSVDVLLIDDIQFIIGKESTQEEFFNTFNDLYGANKAIIISSDKPPKDFDTLDDRYKTRFSWGITADINPPDFETRMAILRKKEELSYRGMFNIPNEVMEYIANNVTSNIRVLEGSLNKLVAYAILQKKEINLELATDALKDMINPNEKMEVTPNTILDVVSDHFHISLSDLTGPKRNAEIVTPRQIIMYMCRKYTNTTYEAIGALLGGRDHSTIKHGEKTITDLITTDENLRKSIEIINKKLNIN